mmetsp:Transcript_52166/g.117939  ORF Transcript_52166/g.117939 Transcript_52166/m.117939 type:complete len:84 (+) Transcript_52166:302-553(+)
MARDDGELFLGVADTIEKRCGRTSTAPDCGASVNEPAPAWAQGKPSPGRNRCGDMLTRAVAGGKLILFNGLLTMREGIDSLGA